MIDLTLVIPGFAASIEGLPEESLPECPSLEYLLGKSRRRRDLSNNFHELLCAQFGLGHAAEHDLPIAALSFLADDNHLPEGIWMRVDPVHLGTGINGLTMQAPVEANLSQRDAILLAEPLEELFRNNGWVLKIPAPTRWYLQLDRRPAIRTSAPDQVLGKDIRHYLPVGEERGIWDRIANEAQMLLHDCEVNLDRERQGLPIINSVWCWGCGSLPDILPRYWSRVFTDSPVARGLAMLSATPWQELPENAEDLLAEAAPGGKVLAVMEPRLPYTVCREFSTIQENLLALETGWIAPLLGAVETGELTRLQLIFEKTSFVYNSWSRLCFWRRPAGLSRAVAE